jgi:hypothetical protein
VRVLEARAERAERVPREPRSNGQSCLKGAHTEVEHARREGELVGRVVDQELLGAEMHRQRGIRNLDGLGLTSGRARARGGDGLEGGTGRREVDGIPDIM